MDREDNDCTRKVGSGRKRKTVERYDRAACRMFLADSADILKTLPVEGVSKHTIYRRIGEGTIS